MESFLKVYNDLKGFVDGFVNSSTETISISFNRENTIPWYAQMDNNYISDLLDNSFTKMCLHKITDKYYGKQLDDLLKEATEITPKTCPLLYSVYSSCCHTLGLCNYPKVYITSRLRSINALSVEVNEKQLILISRMSAISLTPNEQSFLLGHELGHHQQGNLVCHTVNGLLNKFNQKSEFLGTIFSDTFEVSLKLWCRNSEFNSDRAGYLCCKDLNDIMSLFNKVQGSRHKTRYYGFLEQYKSYPFILTRFEKIKEFSKLLQL